MKYDERKKPRFAFYLFIVWLLFAQGCFEENKQQNSNKNSREKSAEDLQRKSELRWYSPSELLDFRNELDNEVRNRFFVTCDEKRWFTEYKGVLYEFQDLKWDIIPKALDDVDDKNGILYKATLKFLSHGDVSTSTQTAKTVIKEYDRKDCWKENYEPFSAKGFKDRDEKEEKAGIKAKAAYISDEFLVIKRREKGWVMNMPFFFRPPILCPALLSGNCLKEYNTPGTNPNYDPKSAFFFAAPDPPMPDEVADPLRAAAYKKAKALLQKSFTKCGDNFWYRTLRWRSEASFELRFFSIVRIEGLKWQYTPTDNGGINVTLYGDRWSAFSWYNKISANKTDDLDALLVYGSWIAKDQEWKENTLFFSSRPELGEEEDVDALMPDAVNVPAFDIGNAIHAEKKEAGSATGCDILRFLPSDKEDPSSKVVSRNKKNEFLLQRVQALVQNELKKYPIIFCDGKGQFLLADGYFGADHFMFDSFEIKTASSDTGGLPSMSETSRLAYIGKVPIVLKNCKVVHYRWYLRKRGVRISHEELATCTVIIYVSRYKYTGWSVAGLPDFKTCKEIDVAIDKTIHAFPDF